MYYSYRGGNGVLPEIRLATSRDGTSWERHSNAEDPTGKDHLFASTPDACFTDRWYLYTQACPLPANRNDIDGKWDLQCFECTAKLPARHGLADLFIPGPPAGE